MSDTTQAKTEERSLDERIEGALAEIRKLLKDTNMSQSRAYLADVANVYGKYGRQAAQEFVRVRSKDPEQSNSAAGRLGGKVDEVIEIMHEYWLPAQVAIFLIKKLDAVQAYKKTGG